EAEILSLILKGLTGEDITKKIIHLYYFLFEVI
ncbi:MAG: hypothetical protein K0R31_2279, partial [Clostridiales bacterium]|nr:hypothetical protein [Clostridiales bacterium]